MSPLWGCRRGESIVGSAFLSLRANDRRTTAGGKTAALRSLAQWSTLHFMVTWQSSLTSHDKRSSKYGPTARRGEANRDAAEKVTGAAHRFSEWGGGGGDGGVFAERHARTSHRSFSRSRVAWRWPGRAARGILRGGGEGFHLSSDIRTIFLDYEKTWGEKKKENNAFAYTLVMHLWRHFWQQSTFFFFNIV